MIRTRDRERLPPLRAFAALGLVESATEPIPGDCSDGFVGAFWQRPDSYLDPRVGENISNFAELTETELESGLARLGQDLENGLAERRYRALLALSELDCGCRLVASEFVASSDA